MRVLVTVVSSLAFAIGAGRAARAQQGLDRKAEGSVDIAKRVDTHLQRGVEFYAEKQYELAIVEFRAGYAIDPRPDFLFALAQAERLSGDCPTAMVYYQRFLDTGPSANQAEAARVNMRRCKRALESGPGGIPPRSTTAALDQAKGAAGPAPPAMPGASRPGTVSRRAPARRSWYRDPLGVSLLAGSVAGLGLSVGFWVAKGSAEAAAADAPDHETYLESLDRARRNRTLAVVSLSAGVALAGVAIYRLASRSSREERTAPERTTLVLAPTSGGAVAGLAGTF